MTGAPRSRIGLLGRLAVVIVLVLAVGSPSAVAQVARPTCFGSVVTILGTKGDDVMQGTNGPDVIVGLEGEDKISGGGGNDKICSGPGNDVMLGEGGNDSLNGGDAVDAIDGGSGDDLIVGGPGDSDGAYYATAPGPVNANLQKGVATGNGQDTLKEIESLDGSSFGDTLVGNAEINVLSGEVGNDTLDGGPHSDALIGGAGDDKLVGRPEDGDAAVFVSSPAGIQADLRAGIATGEGRDTLTNIESLIGSNFADKLVGNAKLNFLLGLGGNDELVAGAGFDVATFLSPVTANLATHQATGSEGTDTLTGFEGLAGSPGADKLIGDANQNFLEGRAGNDVLLSGGGPDVLLGKEGADQLDGGEGNDKLFGGPGDDVLNGGAGPADTVSYSDAPAAVKVDLGANSATGEGSDLLSGVEGVSGSAFADGLTGDSKPNELFGNDGDDALSGGGGSDFLGGGGGNDTVDAGPGTDYCLDDQPAPGCEILGAPTIPGEPAQPPLPPSFRRSQVSGGKSEGASRSPQSDADLLGWMVRAARDVEAVGPELKRGLASLLVAPSIRPHPFFANGAGAERATAEYEYSAEPLCIFAKGKRSTEIAPPRVVRPVGDDGRREEAWWQGTLYRQNRKTGRFARQAKTAWARAQLAGDFVLSGVLAWKNANGDGSFRSPVAIRVPKGLFVWKGQIYWVRSGGRIFAPIEPHIIQAKTIQHRKRCDFKR